MGKRVSTIGTKNPSSKGKMGHSMKGSYSNPHAKGKMSTCDKAVKTSNRGSGSGY